MKKLASQILAGIIIFTGCKAETTCFYVPINQETTVADETLASMAATAPEVTTTLIMTLTAKPKTFHTTSALEHTITTKQKTIKKKATIETKIINPIAFEKNAKPKTIESEVYPVANTEEEIDMNDPTDTDGDDITDVYEIYIYKTDPNNSDTDGDMLPDRYELFMLGTDPIINDSNGNGISDGKEDFDGDGLKTLDEFTRGIDPEINDTDSDAINDYDEIFKYNTNPSKWDTDDDKISDGDEITLGLDPNNPETYGYPDSEYTTEQTLGVDSNGLNYINEHPDNPFTISVDIIAAGVVENNLHAQESAYSNVIENPAIIGVIPELVYSDELKVEAAEISFNINDSIVDNNSGSYVSDSSAFEGIGRLTIFKFFEGYNALLPVETFYDKVNNRVYTNVDELGTYCLIDMEIWLNVLNTGEVISSVNLKPVNLKKKITGDYPKMAKMVQSARNETERDAFYRKWRGSYSDSDQDKLFDFEEILYSIKGIKLINIDFKGIVTLPTLENLKYLIAKNENITYLDRALERYWADGIGTDSLKSNVCGKAVLPIISDPNSKDGDKDGITDFTEYKIRNNIT